MEKIFAPLLLILAFLTGSPSFAQEIQDSIPGRVKVALITPLYLDSAFDRNMTYRYGKNFPKYLNSGLEFYEGAEMAADSLQKSGVPLDLFVFDSRSAGASVNEIIRKGIIDTMDLVIGHVNANEARALANAVAGKNIPFINATYPNDAGVTDNPGYVILNSTLLTHCTAIYKFIQKNYSLAPVVAFTRKGAQEDRLKSYFEDIAKKTPSVPLKIKFVTLQNNFSQNDIQQHLDKDRTTIVIAGSLDINFANQLTEQLAAANTSFPSVLFGMPTWWDAVNFAAPEYKGQEVFFSTPFYVSPVHPLTEPLSNRFKTRFYSRPTDMFFRGYENLFHFTHLLQLNGKNLLSSLSDKRFKVFTDFDIQPEINSSTNTFNYLENRKLYFVKKVDGVVTAIY